MSFKVGDRVRIVECGFGVREMNNGKGMIGTIKIAPDPDRDCCPLFGLDSDEFKTPASERGDEELWWFGKELLELVDARPSVAVPISAVCPRCGGETQDKKTDTYGTIKKCRVCGWC